MFSKEKSYKKLVDKRKNNIYPSELLNPSQIEKGKYDLEEIGPWTRWQGNLNAKILVVGKDWGDVATYIKQKGRDLDKDRTNINLRTLFQEIGIQIGTPKKPAYNAPVFLTNAVLGLRIEGGKAGTLKSTWIKEDSINFLKPLIEIIKPKIIIAMGMDGYMALKYIYHLEKNSLKNLILHNPQHLSDSTLLFVIYHCGQMVTNRIRNMQLQKNDWRSMRNYL